MLRRWLLPVLCVVAAAVQNRILPLDEYDVIEKIEQLEQKVKLLTEENQKLKDDMADYKLKGPELRGTVSGKEDEEPWPGMICLANETTLEIWNELRPYFFSMLNITTCETLPGQPALQYECTPKAAVPIK